MTYQRRLSAGKVDVIAEEQYKEYQEDPIDYLENMMGLEVDQFITDPDDDDAFDPREKLNEAFPNFMAEYEDKLKFEKDMSLDNGVDFSLRITIIKTFLGLILTQDCTPTSVT